MVAYRKNSIEEIKQIELIQQNVGEVMSCNTFAFATRSRQKSKHAEMRVLRQREEDLEFPSDSHVSVISEVPFVIRIDTKGVTSKMRSSKRSTKRKSYLDDEADIDFLDSDAEYENESQSSNNGSKKRKKGKKKDQTSTEKNDMYHFDGDVLYDTILGGEIEPPPTDILPSLWYSRENCIHVWVIEKIIGWKKRSKVEMNWKDPHSHELFRNSCPKIQEKLINAHISNRKKSMEISRISPETCPFVLKTVALREERTAKQEGRQKNFELTDNDEKDCEEVLLIKWRGRSYLHCSWERPDDLEYFDPSPGTVKGKINRYYQLQCKALGMEWKTILENSADSSGTTDQINTVNSPQQGIEDDDYFPPEYVDIERILACDESSLDMSLLSKQRAINIQREKAQEESRANELLGVLDGRHDVEIDVVDETLYEDNESWDPEDYVRYVVKWKGLPIADITWEYWLHIKHDSVDQAEDFWLRQKVPTSPNTSARHPHISEYKKLTESPCFGVSSVKRHVATLGSEGENTTCDDTSEEALDAEMRLRAYQLEGVNWLLWNWWNKRSCILADEMGLGKTIQTVCFLDQLQKLNTTRVRGPFLIVAPLSLVNQWQSEALTWSPDMNVVLYHGSGSARKFLVENEFYYNDQFVPKALAQKLKRQHYTKFHLLITTFEIIMKDMNILSRINWKALIVDEAHRLKNDSSRLFSDLRTIPRDFCLLLTGTPLQNSTEELWSLLNFCNPVDFGAKEDFVMKFGSLSDAQQVKDLHNILKPYLLRRVKEDVEKSLPPKEETIIEVALTPIQKKYYKAIYERNTMFLMKGSKPSNAPSLMNVMMELRKCCNHPFLIKGAEDRIMNEALCNENEVNTPGSLSRYRMILSDQLVNSSGKMVLLMKLLPKLQSGGHKVLIFSQMVRVLDLLEELMKLKNYSYERLDGSVSASSRSAAVRRFNRDSYERFIMLLSTRAGGLGLNLTSADTVIIYDSDWNPQNDLQAMARAHRIGQTRPVHVYRLLTTKTYEMHMFHSASMKLGLDRAVLAHQRHQGDNGGNMSKKRSKENQAKEIDELLKKGAYDIFTEEDDADAKTFMETDIDMLLERNSRTISYGRDQSMINSGLGSFNKASFIASDPSGQDVDLDDPNFWETIGLDYSAETQPENIILDGKKRIRKQVQIYDPYIDGDSENDELLQQQEKVSKKKSKSKKENKEHAIRHIANYPIDQDRFRTENRTKVADENFVNLMELKFHRQKLRSLRKSDPITERLTLGWDMDSRDRTIAALLSYGFGRFCKIRHETNIPNLALQDVELFARSIIFQIGLQGAMSLVTNTEMCSLFNGTFNTDDIWVCRSIMSAIHHYDLVKIQGRELRIPSALSQPDFITKLRSVGVFSLKKLAFLSRFVAVMEASADEALLTLGQEELAKRGCYSKNIAELDADQKLRYLTLEELSFVFGRRLERGSNFRKVAPWWDIECDISLLVGTFLHGLGSYEKVTEDHNLPLAGKLANLKLTFHMTKRKNLILIANTFRAIVAELNNESSLCIQSIQNDSWSHTNLNQDVLHREEPQSNIQFDTNTCSWQFVSMCKLLKTRLKNSFTMRPQHECFDLDSVLSFSDLDSRLYALTGLLDGSLKMDGNGTKEIDNRVVEVFCDVLGFTVCKQAKFRSNLPNQYLSQDPMDLKDLDPTHQNLPRRLVFSRRGLIALAYLDSKNMNDFSFLPSVSNKYSPGYADSDAKFESLPSGLPQSAPLRQAVCATLLCLGTTNSPRFIPVYEVLCGSTSSFSQKDMDLYVRKYLIPHCIELCVFEMEDESQLGTSCTSDFTFWPDPLLPSSQHGWFSREIALCILQRIKLLECVKSIVQLPEDEIIRLIESAAFLKHHFPAWWNTNMSLKLLRHVAKFGLLCVIFDRKKEEPGDLDENFVLSHVKQALMGEVSDTMLPNGKNLLQHFSGEEVEDFVRRQGATFPDSRAILRFLGFVASNISLNHFDEDWAFIDLPVLDEEIFSVQKDHVN